VATGSQFSAQLGLGSLEDARRLSRAQRSAYVGNLPEGVSAPHLKEFFEAAITSTALHDPSLRGEMIRDVAIDKGGR